MKHITEEMNILLKRTGSLDKEEARHAMKELADAVSPVIRIAVMKYCEENNISFEQVIDLNDRKILDFDVDWLRKYSIDVRWDVILHTFKSLELSIIEGIAAMKPDYVFWPSIVIPYNSTQTRGVFVRIGYA